MENGAAVDSDDESAERTVQIREESRAPMGAGRQRNVQWTELHGLPVIELMHDVEAIVLGLLMFAVLLGLIFGIERI